MAITAAGVGSGLDIENIVTQLMSLERRPIDTLESKISDTRAEISAYGNLKSVLSTFQDKMKELSSFDAFRKFTSVSSDEDVLTASTTSSAASGSYSIDVTRLAQNHKLGSNESLDTATFGGGAGDALTLTVAGNSTTVDLSSAKTLSQVRDAINSASDNPGVQATILNTGGGNQRLILTASESGYDNRVELSYGGSIGAGTFGFATANKDALGATLTDLTELDAAFSVDGYALTASSNNVSDAIDGITFELKGIGSSTLTLERDTESIEASAKAFVDAYNEVINTVGDIRGDGLSSSSVLTGVARAMRSVLNTAPAGLTTAFGSLSELGITTNAKTGELEFNSDDFSDALNADFAGVAELFAHDDQGFAFRMESMMDYYLDGDGPVEGRVDSLNDRIRSMENRVDTLEGRMILKEQALRSQYAALDSLIGTLQSTGNFLLSSLSSGQS